MDLIVQCGHNTSSENKQKAWPKVGLLNLVHKDPIAGRDEHSSFQSRAITRCSQNLPVTSWTSATTLKAPVLKQHEFLSNYTPIVYWTARQAAPASLLKSHLGNTRQMTAWKAAEEGSLCNTHRRSGNLKNENQIIGSTPLFSFSTASSAGRLVTQAASKSSCVISSYSLPTEQASAGTCSSHKTNWQLFNLSLWHIIETQKPEVVRLSWVLSNFKLKFPEPPLSTHLLAADL